MSYDIEIINPKTGETLEADRLLNLGGSIQAVGGSKELFLSITYNYREHFVKAFQSQNSIKCLDNKVVITTIDTITNAIERLDTDYYIEDYWKSTEGNARLALINLLILAFEGLEGTWRIT